MMNVSIKEISDIAWTCGVCDHPLRTAATVLEIPAACANCGAAVMRVPEGAVDVVEPLMRGLDGFTAVVGCGVVNVAIADGAGATIDMFVGLVTGVDGARARIAMVSPRESSRV